MNWLKDIKQRLIERGIVLNPAANEQTFQFLNSISPITIPEDLRDIFLEFDGFQECCADPLSEIRLWSIHNIIQYLRQTNTRSDYIPIADFFLKTELICIDNNSVFWEDRLIVLADDVRSFLNSLVSGKYDT